MSVTTPILRSAAAGALAGALPLGAVEPLAAGADGLAAAGALLAGAPVFVQPTMNIIAASTTKIRVRIDSSSRSHPPMPGRARVAAKCTAAPPGGRPLARILLARHRPGQVAFAADDADWIIRRPWSPRARGRHTPARGRHGRSATPGAVRRARRFLHD